MTLKRLWIASAYCWSLLFASLSFNFLQIQAGALQRVENSTLKMPTRPQATNYFFAPLRGLQPLWCLSVTTAPSETNRLFAVNQAGGIVVIPDLQNPVPEVFLDISSRTYFHQESGLLGLAFHPGFTTNGCFFVFYTTLTNSHDGNGIHDRLSRFQIDPANPNRALPDSEVILISQFDEDPNHNSGDLHFGPDGYLYISLGDEGGGNDQFQNAGRIDKDFFSGILRIDVDLRPENLPPNPHPAVNPGTYKVPRDNPFVGMTRQVLGTTVLDPNLDPLKVRTEFYAYGFRNPWRMDFDPVNGHLYAFDVGEDSREEVNIVYKGGFYGWPFREGSLNWEWEVPDDDLIDPLIEYEHSSGHMAITGGFFYRGSLYPELNDSFVFSDFSGAIGVAKMEGPRYSVTWIAKFPGLVFSIARHPATGEILILDGTTGYVQVLKREVVEGSPLPLRLSETGIFKDLKTLEPNPGVVPYEINVSFWSDNAKKRRWFSLPDPTSSFHFETTAPWGIPEGTVWVKHFDMEMTLGDSNSLRRLETRVLVRQSDGVYGASYKWNAEGTEATLVSEKGLDEYLIINGPGRPTAQRWRYPSRLECIGCHTQAGGYALGFNTAQLNVHPSGNPSRSQIQDLAVAGYIDNPPASYNLLPRLAAASETSWSLEYRVRSYFAANCSQCHQPGGQSRANWDARIHVPLTQAGIVNAFPTTSWSTGLTRIVAPGDIEDSVLYRRISSFDGGHMPPLGTSVLDEASIEMVREWIENDLPARKSYEEWAADVFDDPAAPEADWDADPDGDGVTNENEQWLGTDPLNSNSVWRMSLSSENQQLLLSFPRVANLIFEVQTTGSLDPGSNWQPLDVPENQPYASDAEAITEIRIPLSRSQQFFRVLIRGI